MAFKQLLSNKSGKFVTLFVGALSFEEYLRSLKKDYGDDKMMSDLIKDNMTLRNNISDLQELRIEDSVKMSRIENILDHQSPNKSLMDSLERVKSLMDQYNTCKSNPEVECPSKDVIIDTLNHTKDVLEQTQTEFENITTVINKISVSDIFSWDYIQNMISNISEEIVVLSTTQQNALFHICFNITIFLCVLTLIGVFYGDKIIINYKLEERYPKLARIIQLRRRFQVYYFTWNCIIIIVLLLLMISTDIYTIIITST